MRLIATMNIGAKRCLVYGYNMTHTTSHHLTIGLVVWIHSDWEGKVIKEKFLVRKRALVISCFFDLTTHLRTHRLTTK